VYVPIPHRRNERVRPMSALCAGCNRRTPTGRGVDVRCCGCQSFARTLQKKPSSPDLGPGASARPLTVAKGAQVSIRRWNENT